MADASMGAVFTRLARESPAAVAVGVLGGASVTRAELDARADALARAWVAGGLAVDDLVVVSLANASGVDLVVACVAAWKAGATPLPLSPRTPPADWAALLEVARPGAVVDVPPPAPGPAPPLDPDLAASTWKVSPSSGSTGTPKLIRAAAPARVDPERPVTSFLPLRAVQLVAGPLTHAAPFTYATRGLMTGHRVVVMPRFDPDAWLSAVADEQVTWALVVPTMMHRIRRSAGWATADLSSLATVVHLGAACPQWLKRDWLERLGPERLVEVYAGTESQGLTVIDGVEWLAHPGSVGRAAGGSSFRVVRPDGSTCDTGEAGEVLMRRTTSASSYLGVPPGDREGWHSLGDLGHLDADGYLYLAGRIDDVVTQGGVSIAPAPIEAVLEAHPAVRSALVVGRPDDDLGQRLHAVVDVAGADLADTDLAAWVAARLDSERRPRSWELVDRPLRDDAGKARRRDWM